MIQLTCSACKTLLEVDDAFAGGVCRCSHCAAIQTVPKSARAGQPQQAVSAGATASGPAAQQGKTLFRRQGKAVVGSGLDELAQVVASSGLHSQRLKRNQGAGGGGTSSRMPSSAIADAELRRKKNRTALIVGSVAGIVVAGLGFAVLLMSLGHSPQRTDAAANSVAGASSTANAGGPIAAPSGPAIASVDLSSATSVVYLIDRGGASTAVLSDFKQLALQSATSLGSTRQFAVRFWANGMRDVGYPPTSMTAAVPETLTSARKVVDDVVAFGQSDVTQPLLEALALKPDTLVLITAKGFDLDDAWADAVLAERNRLSPKTKVATLSVGSTAQSPPLKRVAERSGGTYLELTPQDLKDITRP